MANASPMRVSNPKAYLFTSVRNTVLNDINGRGRQVTLDVDTAWFVPPDRDPAAEKNLQLALRQIPDDRDAHLGRGYSPSAV
jgi:DNA-directed RNA polymerase specialized sigma24 family protein